MEKNIFHDESLISLVKLCNLDEKTTNELIQKIPNLNLKQRIILLEELFKIALLEEERKKRTEGSN